MASAAEQMAANLSWGALGKATDLRQRILFTILVLIALGRRRAAEIPEGLSKVFEQSMSV